MKTSTSIGVVISALALVGMFLVPEVRHFVGLGFERITISDPPIYPPPVEPPTDLPPPENADGVRFVSFSAVANHTRDRLTISIYRGGKWETRVLEPMMTRHLAGPNSELKVRWNDGSRQLETTLPSNKIEKPAGDPTKYEKKSHFVNNSRGRIILELQD